MCLPNNKRKLSFIITAMFRLVFFIVCLIFFFPHQAATFSSNQTDLSSLLAIKSAIDLDPLGALSSWNAATHDFCSWNGIQCGRRHPDRVVTINLRSQGLVGSLSPHIGNLSLLKYITLQNNTFHGPIPQQITLLTRLRYVESSNNSFNGSIPQNLSNCRDLSYLNLLDNELSGAIPNELGSMSKLEALGLGRNRFLGQMIPPFLGNITSLTKLSLIDGGFVGQIPASFVQLRNLKFLQLAENRLTGTIPSVLFNLSALEYFGAPNNQLHGAIPSTIALPNLKLLDIYDNQFSGPIPASIANASLLAHIQAYDNYFTGPVPRMGSLIHLDRLNFANNSIADDISFISSFTNSSEMRFLHFGGNLLTGSLPESISNLSKQMKSIILYENNIHGKIPSGIGNLDSLRLFSARDNFLGGQIPMEIARLSKLITLYFQRNSFSNEVAHLSFGNMTLLSNLHLNENNLSGNVPSTLANCTNLLELDLSRNNFYGIIPPEILNLSPLSILLNLSHNTLEGSIPNEVGSLTNLVALDLSNNKLSGAIPNSMRKCITLEKLYLDGNFLQGEIPLGLGGLVVLQDLNLSTNNLSGPIPKFLGKLQLHRLDLSFNRLHGEVPIIGVFKNRTSFSLEGNEGLCGGIPELKLPPCPSLESQKKNLSTTLKKIFIPIAVVGGISFMLFALFIHKQKFFKTVVTPSLPSHTGIQIMRLSYLDLSKATDGFSEANLLGFGRFGSVYKGIFGEDDQIMMMAVKVLNLSVRGASRSFLTECNALRNVRHRNLLKILSICDQSIDPQGNEFKALVYEFKCNGSLEKWLQCSGDEEDEENAERNSLNMVQRLNVAIDIAQAVEYLHFGTDISIVHGDLKPSNILLDEDMTAYVGDFGLAKNISDTFLSHESNSISTEIKGTVGYIPPEYGTRPLLSMQGDVYSYGIVLLEMFTNIRPTDDVFEDHTNLHLFVSATLPDRVMEVVDPRLQTLIMNNDKMKECVGFILNIGVSCSKEMTKDRMSMTDVVIELRRIQTNLSR